MFGRQQLVYKIITLLIIIVFSLNFFIGFENFHKKLLCEEIQLDKITQLIDNPLELLNADFYPKVTNFELKDWHDYEFIEYEASRVGLGENGTGVKLTDPKDIKRNRKFIEVEGLSAHISDLISVNRSIPDTRYQQ